MPHIKHHAALIRQAIENHRNNVHSDAHVEANKTSVTTGTHNAVTVKPLTALELINYQPKKPK